MKWDIEGVVINKKLFPCGASQEVVKSAESSGVNQTIQFTTNLRKPFHSVNYTIVPAQEGTGDPSPSNPRAIIGYTKVNMILSAPGISKRNIVTFPTTLYGGEGDESGNFTNKYGIVDLGSLSWTYYTGETEPYFRVLNFVADYNPKLPPNSSTAANLLCSIFKAGKSGSTGTSGSLQNHNYEISLNPAGRLFIIDSDYTDATDLIRDLSGVYLVYELATPETVTVDPITFETFTATQTARFEEKLPFTIEYLVSESEPANYAQQFLPLFYNKERRSL